MSNDEFTVANPARMKANPIRLSVLPAELAAALSNFDADHDGLIDAGELTQVVAHLNAVYSPGARNASKLSIDAFPPAVRDIIKGFDLDNSGDISASELAEAAKLYAREKAKNKRLCCVITGMSIAGVFILAVMFGLICAATYAIVQATTTMKAASAALVNNQGQTLRTAGGSLGSVGFQAVARRRDLETYHGEHGRRLAHALDYLDDMGEDELYHYRRPIGEQGVSFDAHGRALVSVAGRQLSLGSRELAVLAPIDRSIYLTLGTTPTENATSACQQVQEGQTALHMRLPITKNGANAPQDMVVDTQSSDVYGCKDYSTNGYGLQALVYYNNWMPSTGSTPAESSTIELLLECPVVKPGLLCSVSKRVARRRLL